MVSGIQDNSVIESLNGSYPERKSRPRLKLERGKKQQSLILTRMRDVWSLLCVCGLDSVHVFVWFKHDHRDV